jgi:ABC-type protease/lipase transport system fused ATPase/permease subunit
MSACPTPESYGPPVLCDTTTFPYEPLVVTGFDPVWLLVVALAGLLVGALILLMVALLAAKAAHVDAAESRSLAQDAVDLLEAERRYTVALETYLPGEENGERA